jgi:hypothetical protein
LQVRKELLHALMTTATTAGVMSRLVGATAALTEDACEEITRQLEQVNRTLALLHAKLQLHAGVVRHRERLNEE